MTAERNHWGIADVPGLVAEIDRDLADRQASYPGLVAKLRLKQEEADYLLALLADIRRDLDHAFGAPPWHPPAPAFGWSVKVQWMRAELARREEAYPAQVAKGRLSQADADRRIRALKSLVGLYWAQMFAWEPGEGPALDYWRAMRRIGFSNATAAAGLHDSAGARAYRQLVREHMVAVDQELNGQGRLVA